MTRRVTSLLAVFTLLLIIIFDTVKNPPNAFNAPAAFALGSGEVSKGGFCGDLPSK